VGFAERGRAVEVSHSGTSISTVVIWRMIC
jgi:hypothetical protein